LDDLAGKRKESLVPSGDDSTDETPQPKAVALNKQFLKNGKLLATVD
jgi:hypothetical protein